MGFSEASKHESKLVFQKFEMRMITAVEGARRDAIRNGRDERTVIGRYILRDEKVAAIFNQAVAEASRAGLLWVIFDAMDEGHSAIECAKEHWARVSEDAEDWLVSIVVGQMVNTCR